MSCAPLLSCKNNNLLVMKKGQTSKVNYLELLKLTVSMTRRRCKLRFQQLRSHCFPIWELWYAKGLQG